jgi:hypothetical protein
LDTGTAAAFAAFISPRRPPSCAFAVQEKLMRLLPPRISINSLAQVPVAMHS